MGEDREIRWIADDPELDEDLACALRDMARATQGGAR